MNLAGETEAVRLFTQSHKSIRKPPSTFINLAKLISQFFGGGEV